MMLTWQQSTSSWLYLPKGFSDYQKEYVLKIGVMDLFWTNKKCQIAKQSKENGLK